MPDDLVSELLDRLRARERVRAERSAWMRSLETRDHAGGWDTDAAWLRLAQDTGIAPRPRPDAA